MGRQQEEQMGGAEKPGHGASQPQALSFEFPCLDVAFRSVPVIIRYHQMVDFDGGMVEHLSTSRHSLTELAQWWVGAAPGRPSIE